jgi:hypothetical protein
MIRPTSFDPSNVVSIGSGDVLICISAGQVVSDSRSTKRVTGIDECGHSLRSSSVRGVEDEREDEGSRANSEVVNL